jgi:uncharacterized membrane protein YecN with MAPEG domain
MDVFLPVGLVTLAVCLMYMGMAVAVSRTRNAVGIQAPLMTGDPLLERTIRAHINTLEWLPIFLPALWLFAVYANPRWAAILGVLWIVGRIVYFSGYRMAAERRRAGFFIQAIATLVLIIGAAARIIYLMVFLPR